MSYQSNKSGSSDVYGTPDSMATARPPRDATTSPTVSSPYLDIPGGRRSSISNTVDALRHAGGPNSIDNFARSWTRAAGYFEITPGQTYVLADEGVDPRDAEAQVHIFSPAFEDDAESDIDYGHERSPMLGGHAGGADGFTYGSLGSIRTIRGSIGGGPTTARLDDGSMQHAADLFQQQQGLTDDMKEREPLLVKRIEREDGKVVVEIVGQSTLPQTVFNSVNVLIGVGLLSLPLGLKYSGWVIGMIFLAFSASVTNYTAKLLARCLDKAKDQTLVTYADIAYAAFGHKARIWISLLFSMELLAACVALIILFADSLNVLIPSVSVTQWKILAGFILTPLSFLPLRVLSFSSILGIISCFMIVSIIFIDGLYKPEAPGSLRDPMPTHMWPEHWATVPMSFGLLMSPWGGHSVFPNIYKDMRHPYKYNKGVDITYIFTYGLDVFLAIIGILMFGDQVRDEITASILSITAYPKFLNMLIVVFISIIPLTKMPLNSRPIVVTLEVMFGLDARSISLSDSSSAPPSATSRGLTKILVRVVCHVVFVTIAILFPSFDRIMALLGSFLCFSICVILPLAFYLKICGEDIGKGEKVMDWVLLVFSTICAASGTAWSLLPEGVLPGW